MVRPVNPNKHNKHKVNAQMLSAHMTVAVHVVVNLCMREMRDKDGFVPK